MRKISDIKYFCVLIFPLLPSMKLFSFQSFCIILRACFFSFYLEVFIPLYFDFHNFYPQAASMTNNYLRSFLAKFTSKETLFVNAILSENKESAKTIAFELYKKSPQYLLFYYLLNSKENKALILKLIESIKNLDGNLIYLLLKSEDFTHDELLPFKHKIHLNSFIGLCIEKQFFLKKYEKNFKPNLNEQKEIAKELIELIRKIDDFALYDFALKHGIDFLKYPCSQNEFTCLKGENYIRESQDANKSNKATNSADNSINKSHQSLENNLDSLYNHPKDKETIQNNSDQIKVLSSENESNSIQTMKNTINMSWYKIIKNKDSASAREILLNSINFQDVKKVLDYCPIESTGFKTYDILIKYLKGEDPKELLSLFFTFLHEDGSFLSMKILLALLIATREEKLLLLALHLSETNKFEDNYEIQLINLFLCRYFLLFKNIRKNFESLDIKNVQVHNLTFIWSDPMIVSNIKLTDEISTFKREITKMVTDIENSIISSLDNFNIAISLSLIELRNKLKKSTICQEIQTRQIVSKSKFSMFSGLLGEKCEFLFDKIVIEDARSVAGSIPTLRTTPASKFSEDIFNNQFLNINDQNLITAIKKNLNCFK